MRSRAAASVANGDRITAYLEELRHLREAAAANVATGMSEQAAQAAAIVAFGRASGFSTGELAAPIVACAIAGLVVLVGYLIARRRRPRCGLCASEVAGCAVPSRSRRSCACAYSQITACS